MASSSSSRAHGLRREPVRDQRRGRRRPTAQGLNPLLRNFYMIIHPPSLYTGFVSSAIPFAFAVAALVTGRLDNEWIVASRKWMLFSWLFLSIGNTLGMLWAYEELGWGGYWAWDPVENAAFMPWLTASAYVHSIMIQERRGMLKVWNVFLICLTFFLTIFGTFLTRSGVIASVHSFAQSGIGIFFVYFMGVILAVCIGAHRLPPAQAPRARARSSRCCRARSRSSCNNWGFVSLMVFIAVATTWPRISEWLLDQKSTLGPTFYNTWIPPLALRRLRADGRRAAARLAQDLARALPQELPLAGRRDGRRWRCSTSPSARGSASPRSSRSIRSTRALARRRARLDRRASTRSSRSSLVAFNLAVVVQEFARGVAARQKRGDEARASPRSGQPRRQVPPPLRRLRRPRRHRGHVPRLRGPRLEPRQGGEHEPGRHASSSRSTRSRTSARAWRSTRRSG